MRIKLPAPEILMPLALVILVAATPPLQALADSPDARPRLAVLRFTRPDEVKADDDLIYKLRTNESAPGQSDCGAIVDSLQHD